MITAAFHCLGGYPAYGSPRQSFFRCDVHA
ncbi:hypothetical protein O9992_25580 [Vibrio lentus]|nr:hypothetical protein [Vibrio lentus]